MGSPGFWLVVGLVAFVLSLGITAVSYRVTQTVSAIADRIRHQLARDAETFGEPTREQVEAPWLDEATEEIHLDLAPATIWLLPAVVPDDDDCLFGDAAAYFDSARFEAEVLADIDSLPPSWSFR